MENTSQEDALENQEPILDVCRKLQSLREVPLIVFLGSIYPDEELILKRVIDAIRGKPSVVDLMIVTSGGFPDIAYRIIKYLRGTFSNVNVILPYKAKSAGTLISVAGSKIVFGPYGELGPVDVQVSLQDSLSQSANLERFAFDLLGERAGNLFRSLYRTKPDDISSDMFSKHCMELVAETFSPLYRSFDPLHIAELNQFAKISNQYLDFIFHAFVVTREDLLNMGLINDGDLHNIRDIDQKSAARKLTPVCNRSLQKLVQDYPSHSFVIDYAELQHIFNPIEKALQKILCFRMKSF